MSFLSKSTCDFEIFCEASHQLGDSFHMWKQNNIVGVLVVLLVGVVDGV